MSDEAKKHAEMVLKSGELDSGDKLTEEGEKNPGNVAGGLKAYVNTPSSLLILNWIHRTKHGQGNQQSSCQ